MGCSGSKSMPKTPETTETPVTTLKHDVDLAVEDVGGGGKLESKSQVIISEQVARLAAPVGAAVGANLHEVTVF